MKCDKIQVMAKGENTLIEWIRLQAGNVVSRHGAGGQLLGIGDDMAIIPWGDSSLLIASDMLLDGVHFDTNQHAPGEIGRKALAVNLSDCAAMAARPMAFLTSIALPNDWSQEQAQALMGGMLELAAAYECQLIGGDTNSWNRPLAVDVTVLAEPYETHMPVRRSGARVGDLLLVTGKLGGSIAGHHMSFAPRVEAARQLAATLGESLHAMMDISDGLATDAPRMAAASNVGMVFERAALLRVASVAAKEHAADDDAVLQSVVGDGEDFELFFAVDPAAAEKVATLNLDCDLTQIGHVTDDRYVMIRDEHGKLSHMPAGGWQHFQ